MSREALIECVPQIIRRAVDQRIESPSEPGKDMLGSFLARGIPRDQIDAELVISL